MAQAKKFHASLEHLYEMLGWIVSEAKRLQLGPKDLHRIELASEEALVNIIHYAYGDLGGEIEISLSHSGGLLRIEISDWGKFFNPLKLEAPDLSGSMSERKVGGLGVHLMRQCLDELLYTRKGGRNILTLIKKVHPQ